MSLIIPNKVDYALSSDKITGFFNNQNIDYCIYGSFLFPDKLRYGLSDIDIFVISSSEEMLFPIEVQKCFYKIKSSIETLGIPLQINWTTRGQIRNNFFSPDLAYINEVKKGIEVGLKSSNFENEIGFLNHRNQINDDEHMARFFFRKVNELGLYIEEIKEIIKLEENQIDIEQQKKLLKVWNSFKKMNSLYTLIIRIIKGESHFSKSEIDIAEILNKSFDIRNIDITIYSKKLTQIENIKDWFYFLKNGGFNELINIYNNIFIPLLSLISKKIKN